MKNMRERDKRFKLNEQKWNSLFGRICVGDLYRIETIYNIWRYVIYYYLLFIIIVHTITHSFVRAVWWCGVAAVGYRCLPKMIQNEMNEFREEKKILIYLLKVVNNIAIALQTKCISCVFAKLKIWKFFWCWCVCRPHHRFIYLIVYFLANVSFTHSKHTHTHKPSTVNVRTFYTEATINEFRKCRLIDCWLINWVELDCLIS